MELILGDCLEEMKSIPENSIDLILCDLPYGKSRNLWDRPIPFKPLWEAYKRVLKSTGTAVLFGIQPFSSYLLLWSPIRFRYSLVWHKSNPVGFLNSKIMPLRAHEDILVFGNTKGIYNPQKTQGHPRKVSTAFHRRNCVKTTNYNEHIPVSYDSTERYPTSVLAFPRDTQTSKIHPTQKPILLIEYLIKTYSNENALVLDNCMGSGTTGIAAKTLNRDFIGIEINEEYFTAAKNRIEKI